MWGLDSFPEIKSILKLSKCGATEHCWEFHGRNARQMNGYWKQVKVKKELLGRVKSLKMGYYDHVVRKYNGLGKEVIQWCTSGSRRRGRQRRWCRPTDDISEWTGMEINDAERAAEQSSMERTCASRQPFEFTWRTALDDNDDQCADGRLVSQLQ